MSRRPRIAIDLRYGQTGLGTYARQLQDGFLHRNLPFDVIAVTSQDGAPKLSAIPQHEIRVVEAPMYSVKSQLLQPLRTWDAALFHAIHYDLPLLHPRRIVVTIHDLIHLSREFVPNTGAYAYAWAMLNLAARRAAHIITVSTYSKYQIVDRLRISPSKITVIHNSVGSEWIPRDPIRAFADVRAGINISRPYLLYVGNLKPHKNVARLIEAFANLRNRGFEGNLIIIGDDVKWAPSLRLQCHQLGIFNDVLIIPHVSKDLLISLYQAAAMLVLPSLIEGFGLTILEAMACGTPVVCSRSGPLPEVAGDAAMFFDPHSTENLAWAIDRIWNSEDLRRSLREKGLARVQCFSLEQNVTQHLDVYCKVLGIDAEMAVQLAS